MAENTNFHLDFIIIDRELQAREGIDWNHVADIAEAIKAGIKIKRARVMRIEDPEDVEHHGKHYGIDQHRIEGYRLAGKKEVPGLGLVGKWSDARDLATSSNTEHNALKRSREAKERAVQMCWEDHPDWTPGRVAKHCSVSPGMAKEWMETVPAAKAVPQEKRVGLDGKKRRTPKPPKNGKPARDPADPDRFQPILSAFANVTRQINALINETGNEKLKIYFTYRKLIIHPGAKTIVDGDNVTPEPTFKGFPEMGFIVREAAKPGRIKTVEELKAAYEKWKEEKQSFIPQRS